LEVYEELSSDLDKKTSSKKIAKKKKWFSSLILFNCFQNYSFESKGDILHCIFLSTI
jgi:hypothetical protein